MPTKKPVNLILRPGTFTDANGRVVKVTAAMCNDLAESYDPELSKAPLVVGHPKMNHPAWGHIKKVSSIEGGAGGIQLSEVQDVAPAFRAAVNGKRYPKCSLSFYMPGTVGNPKPGSHYVRHLGFLGGLPPAVKGMGDISLSDGGDSVCIELGEGESIPTLPDSDESGIHEKNVLREFEDLTARKAELEKAEKKLVEDKAAFEKSQKEASEKSTSNLAGSCLAFAEKNLNRVGPANVPALGSILFALSVNAPVEFGEGEGATNALDSLKSLIASLPVQVEFGEFAPGCDVTDEAPVELSAADGSPFDPGRAKLHQSVLAHSKANNVDYQTALVAIQRGGAR